MRNALWFTFSASGLLPFGISYGLSIILLPVTLCTWRPVGYKRIAFQWAYERWVSSRIYACHLKAILPWGCLLSDVTAFAILGYELLSSRAWAHLCSVDCCSSSRKELIIDEQIIQGYERQVSISYHQYCFCKLLLGISATSLSPFLW
jgi:hypothetical protein